MNPMPVFGTSFAEFAEAAEVASLPSRGLASTVYRGLFHSGSLDFRCMPSRVAALWSEAFQPGYLEAEKVFEEDGEYGLTKKARFALPDGSAVETVLIPMAVRPGSPPKNTLCVSSQVGCAMGCVFCRTGAKGLSRNLATWEIVSQAATARFRLGWNFGNIVFMGMGEALENFSPVASSIAVFMDRRGFSMAAESITVCTAGLPEGINRLKGLGLKRLGLSVSLNSGFDGLRARLMPGASRRANLDSLTKSLAAYPMRDNFVLGVNFCLIPGVNDTEAEVNAIGEFCRKAGNCLVNVIPYNPGDSCWAAPPSAEDVQLFMERLATAGIRARTRAGKGLSIMGACGQLAGRRGA